MSIITIVYAIIGLLLTAAAIVFAVGMLSYWAGRYSAFTESESAMDPGKRHGTRLWTLRVAARHGVFGLMHLRDTLDATIRELEAKGYPTYSHDMDPEIRERLIREFWARENASRLTDKPNKNNSQQQ